MPRVSIKKNEYQVKDFTRKIKGKCAEAGIRQSDLADALDLSQQSLSYKMIHGNYSLTDFFKITNYLKFTEEEIINLVGR